MILEAEDLNNLNILLVSNESKFNRKYRQKKKIFLKKGDRIPTVLYIPSLTKKSMLNDGLIVKRVVDESKYKAKKPVQKESEYKLDINELEKQIQKSIQFAEKTLQKLKEGDQQDLIFMKKKYPLRFCIIHQYLFEIQEQYETHVLKNDPALDKIEGFGNFQQCDRCFDVFRKHGQYKRHIERCTGQNQIMEKLTPKKKKLLEISEQLKDYK